MVIMGKLIAGLVTRPAQPASAPSVMPVTILSTRLLLSFVWWQPVTVLVDIMLCRLISVWVKLVTVLLSVPVVRLAWVVVTVLVDSLVFPLTRARVSR